MGADGVVLCCAVSWDSQPSGMSAGLAVAAAVSKSIAPRASGGDRNGRPLAPPPVSSTSGSSSGPDMSRRDVMPFRITLPAQQVGVAQAALALYFHATGLTERGHVCVWLV